MQPPLRPVVRAAGAVVTRPGREVLLVHRPRYDDWSFPKGKVDPGEHVVAAAVREVAEETGLRVRLGVPLTGQRYPVTGRSGPRDKTVAYWSARVLGDDDVTGYTAEDEIDEVAWVAWADAPARLTYDYDRATLAEALGVPRRTHPLVVLRHGDTHPRSRWREDDRLRPLDEAGHDQARRWVPLLAAYGVERVVTSPSTRCVQSVQAYVDATAHHPELPDALSEEGADAAGVRRVVAALLHDAPRTSSVLCTHRPVLPLVWEALGLPPRELAKGEALVVHHRKGVVVATELQAV
ncbi:NUDIX hydrolase [Nocardioides alkalitolerans]|uniref:NUDIX hydrolase n=1 Tax=Nocardioides alkalitolerans TaxID=281714 RepID=UPI0004004DF2|nr:NUDIX hydrolase [Nocardioides alkalitolerans]